jgi:hypothetical protein
VNHILIKTIRPAMMNYLKYHIVWLQRHLDDAIANYTNWQPEGSISIHSPNHQMTGGRLIEILMIPNQTPWRIAVHFVYEISPTGGTSIRRHTRSMPICPMWLATYSLLYNMLSEWRPVISLCETLSARHSLKPIARCFRNKL